MQLTDPCRSLLVFTGIFTFLVDAYPLYAASALAANAFVRCAFAGKRALPDPPVVERETRAVVMLTLLYEQLLSRYLGCRCITR